jgi:hypothetical protein
MSEFDEMNKFHDEEIVKPLVKPRGDCWSGTVIQASSATLSLKNDNDEYIEFGSMIACRPPGLIGLNDAVNKASLALPVFSKSIGSIELNLKFPLYLKKSSKRGRFGIKKRVISKQIQSFLLMSRDQRG